MSATEPETYSLHIVSEHGASAWALGHGITTDDVTIVASGTFTEAENDTIRRHVITSMIDHLETTDAYRNHQYIDVSVFDSAARRLLLSLGGQFGPITILSKSQMNHREGWDRHGWRHCRALLSALPGHPSTLEPEQRPVIEAGTDGSIGWGRGKGASWAWARNDGRYGYGTLRTTDILVAELRAIHQLLLSAEAGERLRIRTDSTSALTSLTKDIGTERSRHSNAVENLVRNIKQAASRMQSVEFVWVKGHGGDPLNDAADRLARLARQTATGVAESSRNSIARNIMTDALQEFVAA
jgi:ribonuclease HI